MSDSGWDELERGVLSFQNQPSGLKPDWAWSVIYKSDLTSSDYLETYYSIAVKSNFFRTDQIQKEPGSKV